MNTLFYSRKGGQGKTTHAVAFARYSGAHFVTFDYDNGTRALYGEMLPEDHFHEITPTGKLIAYEGQSHVFDFGGYLDDRVITTAKVCDQCVVPIAFQSPAEIKPFIDTVAELQKHNSNICILINNTEREYLAELRENIEKSFSFPIFVIPRTKFIAKLSVYQKTPIELLESGEAPIFLRHHLKKLAPVMGEFYNYLSQEKTNEH